MHYKALTLDRIHGEAAWEIGVPMPGTGPGTYGGYHLAASAAAAVGGSAGFPLELFEAEPCGDLLWESDTGACFSSARIVRPVPKPAWVRRTEEFLTSIKDVRWLTGCDKPRRAWRLFDTQAEALAAAQSAAQSATRAQAWLAAHAANYSAAESAPQAAGWLAAQAVAQTSAQLAVRLAVRTALRAVQSAVEEVVQSAVRDAEMQASMEVSADLAVPDQHREHARSRWEVWERGYGLVNDVGGRLYVYRRL